MVCQSDANTYSFLMGNINDEYFHFEFELIPHSIGLSRPPVFTATVNDLFCHVLTYRRNSVFYFLKKHFVIK